MKSTNLVLQKSLYLVFSPIKMHWVTAFRNGWVCYNDIFKSNTLRDSSNKQFLYHVASNLRKINMECIFSNANNEAKFIEHIVPGLTNAIRIENGEFQLIKLGLLNT